MPSTIDMDADFDAIPEDFAPLASLGPTPASSSTSTISGDRPVNGVVAPPPITSRPGKSPVWLHFRKAEDYEISKKASCMHCDKTLVASRSSTSTMLTHLQKKHPGPLAASSSGR
jgi:hypothetical protein